MKYYLRIFGWLLLGMGVVLGIVGLLAAIGLMQVQIDFFGIDLDTSAERIAWTAGWLVAAAAGLALLFLTRHGSQHESDA